MVNTLECISFFSSNSNKSKIKLRTYSQHIMKFLDEYEHSIRILI